MERTTGGRLDRVTNWIYLALVTVTFVFASASMVWASDVSWQVKVLAVTTAAATGAGLLISARRNDFSLAWCVFWLWTYVFMGLAPLYQIAAGAFPWRGHFDDRTLLATFGVILSGCLVAVIAESITHRVKRARGLARIGLEPPNDPRGTIRLLFVVLIAVFALVAIGFIVITGPALMAGKTELQHQLLANTKIPGAGSMFFIATAGAITIPSAAIVARRNGVKVPLVLVAVAVVLGFAVTNPLAGSRFLTGSFLIAVIGALVIGRPLARLIPAAVGVALVTVFPSLDLFRGNGTGSNAVSIATPAQSLVGFDFDSFEMLARALTVIGHVPMRLAQPLDLLIAPLLRWIPGLSRGVQGEISGKIVAELTHMSFTNVSMPLWGEGMLVAGLFGVMLYFGCLGVMVGLIRPALDRSVARPWSTRLVVDASVAALLFIALRGSLYEVLGYVGFAAFVGILAWAVTRFRAPRVRSTEDLGARPTTIAFYLPQYHRIAENDEWWGEGFTEWTNVRKAQPQFDGHDHPRQSSELAEYDLADVAVMHDQAALARDHDVDAFCFYFYWFGGTRLLERPVDQYIAEGPDFPFCLSWANEGWTRRWDGKDHESLIAQEYGDETAEAVFDAMLPYLRNPRYLRIEGRAVLLVHRMDHLPAGPDYAQTWHQLADQAGVGPLLLVAAETHPGIDPRAGGFDATAEFPPVGSNTLAAAQLLPIRGLSRAFRGRLMSFERLARRFMRRDIPEFPRFRGVVPGWDNTARRGSNATVYTGSTPSLYRDWLAHARIFEQRIRGANGLVLINAWNEWAEGAHLEPDVTSGRAYLESTRWHAPAVPPSRVAQRLGPPTYAWIHSIALATAGSVLQMMRQLASAMRRATR